jgi:hypothetical protein
MSLAVLGILFAHVNPARSRRNGLEEWTHQSRLTDEGLEKILITKLGLPAIMICHAR